MILSGGASSVSSQQWWRDYRNLVATLDSHHTNRVRAGFKIILSLFWLNCEISSGITSTLYLYSGLVFLDESEFIVIGLKFVIWVWSSSNSVSLLFCFCWWSNNSSWLTGTILNVALSAWSDWVLFSTVGGLTNCNLIWLRSDKQNGQSE